MKKRDNTEWKHPELMKGEMFLSNSTIEGFDLISWKSKRMGIQAFNYDNEMIDSINNLYPIFVQRAEYESGINKRI